MLETRKYFVKINKSRVLNAFLIEKYSFSKTSRRSTNLKHIVFQLILIYFRFQQLNNCIFDSSKFCFLHNEKI